MNDRLEFDSIEVAFGRRNILSSVHMCCEAGKITGLLGRNGCGKTTLMKIVFGAIPFEQKSVRINERTLGIDYLSKNFIGYVPQSNLIPGYLTLRKAFSLFGIDPDEIIDGFPETDTMMDLRPGELSGGYLRIFETLLILRSKASFCLLDEPFTGLTPVYIEKMKAIIMLAKTKKGIIITDHLHRHVMEMSDRLYVLASGQTYLIRDHAQLISLGYVNSL